MRKYEDSSPGVSIGPNTIVAFKRNSYNCDVITNHSRVHHEDEHAHAADLFSLRFGKSNSFAHLRDFRYFKQQAESCIDHVHDKPLVPFGDIALDYLVNAINNQERWYARHPALFDWDETDSDALADMVDTLRCYLLADKSVARAAQNLHVHKNTVLYRIRQLQERSAIDLDDDMEREYLLVSLLVNPLV